MGVTPPTRTLFVADGMSAELLPLAITSALVMFFVDRARESQRIGAWQCSPALVGVRPAPPGALVCGPCMETYAEASDAATGAGLEKLGVTPRDLPRHFYASGQKGDRPLECGRPLTWVDLRAASQETAKCWGRGPVITVRPSPCSAGRLTWVASPQWPPGGDIGRVDDGDDGPPSMAGRHRPVSLNVAGEDLLYLAVLHWGEPATREPVPQILPVGVSLLRTSRSHVLLAALSLRRAVSGGCVF